MRFVNLARPVFNVLKARGTRGPTRAADLLVGAPSSTPVASLIIFFTMAVGFTSVIHLFELRARAKAPQ